MKYFNYYHVLKVAFTPSDMWKQTYTMLISCDIMKLASNTISAIYNRSTNVKILLLSDTTRSKIDLYIQKLILIAPTDPSWPCFTEHRCSTNAFDLIQGRRCVTWPLSHRCLLNSIMYYCLSTNNDKVFLFLLTGFAQ